jgi:hypothetical protein
MNEILEKRKLEKVTEALEDDFVVEEPEVEIDSESGSETNGED